MRRTLTTLVTAALAALLLLPPAALAESKPTEEQATALQKQADEARGRKEQAQQSLDAERAKLKALLDKLAGLKADLAAAENGLKSAEPELKKQQATVATATANQQKADTALATAKKEADSANQVVATAKSKLDESRKAFDVAAKSASDVRGKPTEKEDLEKVKRSAEAVQQSLDALAKATDAAKKPNEALQAAQSEQMKQGQALADAQAALKMTQDRIASFKQTTTKAPEEIKKLDAEIAALTPAVVNAQQTFNAASKEWLDKQQAAEKAFIELGKLVSFSETIAPVFAQRCLACHNARTAKGRLNMETYAAIMKGGESGPVVDPEEGDFSMLALMVEDGSMPKDADPLTKEQIAAIKKWIVTGAKLDAGDSPDAPLTEIMPSLPQPDPPEAYRVPIPVTAVAFSPDGGQLASSGYHEVILWSPGDGKQLRRITNVAERVYDIEYSPDGKLIAVAAGTPAQLGEVKLFSAADGKLAAGLVTSGDSVFAVAFSPDGKRLATAGADRAIRVFDVATHRQLSLIEDHADWVMDVTWSPDGTKLASASRDKTSKVFDMTAKKTPMGPAALLAGQIEPQETLSGESLVTFNGHGEPVFGVGFSPDGKNVVTAGADKQIRVWDITNAKQVRAIGGFGDEVFRVIVTQDSHVYSSSADKTARLHNLANGQAVRTFSGHADWVYSVAFHPATKKVATGSYDGEIRVWNAEDGKTAVTFIAAPGYKAEATASAEK